MNDKPIRCGTFGGVSPEDRKIIDLMFDEVKEKPHVHVWCSWLPSKTPGEEFRKCIDCGDIQSRLIQREERQRTE